MVNERPDLRVYIYQPGGPAPAYPTTSKDPREYERVALVYGEDEIHFVRVKT